MAPTDFKTLAHFAGASDQCIAATEPKPQPVLPDQQAWDKAWAALLDAHKASDDFEAFFERKATERAKEINAVPHFTHFSPYHGKTFTTANPMDVRQAEREFNSKYYVETCAYDGPRNIFAFLLGARAYQAQIDAINERYDWDGINDRYDALSAAICDAEQALFDMPAPSGEALLWKVVRLYKPLSGDWADGVEDQTVADLHRMLLNGKA